MLSVASNHRFVFQAVLLTLALAPLTRQTFAQDPRRVDSLTTVLQTQNPPQQFSTLIQLALAYIDKDNNKSLEYVNQAQEKAGVVGDTAMIVKSGRLKGQVLRRLDRLDEAMELFHKIIPIAERNKLTFDYKLMLNSLAIAYADRANYGKALEYHFKSFVLRESEGNKSEMAVSLHNIGRVYYAMNDYEKALEYFNRALELKQEANDKFDVDMLLINIGYCYNSIKLFDESEKYINRGLKVCGKDCLPIITIQGEFGLGFSQMQTGRLESSKQHFQTSYKLAVEMDNKAYQAENLIMLAQVAIKENDHDTAINALAKAQELCEASGYNKLLIEIYRHFFSLYKNQNDFEKATLYQDKYIELKDSIYSEGLIKNLATVQSQFDERENIKTIASRNEQLARQRSLNIAIIVIAVLASLLVFMLFRSNISKRKANDRLDKEVKAATKDLQAANQLLAEVNKELDHFIYKTSHDIRGPLATLKGLCNVALVDVTDQVALNYLDKLDFTAGQLDTLLRRLQKINQINNSPLHNTAIDFEEIIEEVELVEKRKGLPKRLTIIKDIQSGLQYAADRELIGLVLENLIANAVKFHNQSERVDPFVKVNIGADDRNLVIKVIDNGIGIGQSNPEELFQMFARASERSAYGGIGLYLSRRATHKLGGQIDMHSTNEGYTEVVVTLPLEGHVSFEPDTVREYSRDIANRVV